MRLLRVIFKHNFAVGHRNGDEKWFQWWKTVVAGLMVIAVTLLLATYILSGADMGENSSSYGNSTHDKVSSTYYGQKSISVEITHRILPMAQVYCSIQNCMVRCSLIPAASNPGIVAAVFVDSEYQSHCPDKLLVEELTFDNCNFGRNALSSGWFPSKYQLRKLTLRSCSLTAINTDAFHTEPFEALGSLVIIESGVTFFQKLLFEPLTNLEELVIANNIIERAEADLLAGAANTLQLIQIENSIFSEDVLINITGKSPLPNVLLVSLTGNSIANIPANVFKGIPNAQSVYLTNSGISSIETGAFDQFSGSIRQLFLSDNKISSLPKDVFESIAKMNSNFKLTLGNNYWNCNCELEWLQNMISRYLISTDEPRCVSPERNAELKFSEASFCDVKTSNDIEVPTRPNPTMDLSNGGDTTEATDQETDVPGVHVGQITLFCPIDEGSSRTFTRRLLSTREFNFWSRFPAFSVQEKENGSVQVTLNSTSSGYTLMWFGDDVGTANSDFGGISCITNVKDSLYLNDLRSGGLYTICLLNMFGDLTSPFNCISLKKSTNYEQSLWLANEDKTKIIGCLTAVLIFVCIVSVTGSYYVVWRNPKLLKGSKRIIIVSHRAADAIVLPEGLNPMSRLSSQRDNYMTPMSKRRLLTRKSSVISRTSSRSSATSYVSGIEPTSMQLMSWRIKMIGDNFSCRNTTGNDDGPPPLPPPRNKSIPSLSLNVDERRSSNDQTLVSMFTVLDERQINLDEKTNEQIL